MIKKEAKRDLLKTLRQYCFFNPLTVSTADNHPKKGKSWEA
jgi:hypothetical protein